VSNDKHDPTDEARAKFVFGEVYVRGKNAAKAFWMIFIVAAIAALGWTIPNIIEALRR
jgi:hypothetical protein